MTDYNLHEFFETGVEYYQLNNNSQSINHIASYIKFYKFTKKSVYFDFGYFDCEYGSPKLHVWNYERKLILHKYDNCDGDFYYINIETTNTPKNRKEMISLDPQDWRVLTDDIRSGTTGVSYKSADRTLNKLPLFS